MKRAATLAIACLMLAVPAPAWAQFRSERVEGLRRVCVYAGQSPTETREHKVGLGEACPAYIPHSDPNRPVPPTARLESTAIRDGLRVCTYVQRNNRWAYEIPQTVRCPANVGMLLSNFGNEAGQD